MDEKKLIKGMVFDNPHLAAEFIGYNNSIKTEHIYKALKHYCVFHKDNQLRIYIDEVYETPIPFKTNDYVYEVGQELENKFGKFIVKDRYMKKRSASVNFNTRLYLCVCQNEDATEFELSNQQIKNGCGCPKCGRSRVIPGHSFYDEYPELHIYLENPNDARKYCPMSSKKILCRCPYCRATKKVAIGSLAQNGFSCSNCSDGISYPNKFIQNLLDSLNVAHDQERVFDWSDNKIYDQYLEQHNCIIENHGAQHYRGDINTQFPLNSLEKQQKNDQYKYQLAINNGIEHYIILNCSHSTLSWMKQEIMSSELPILLDFCESDIDWETIHNQCCTSKIRQAWEYWNNLVPTSVIANILRVSETSIRSYIRKGIECGKCLGMSKKDKDYVTPSQRNNNYTNGQMKPIYNVTDDIYFASKKECADYHSDLFNSANSAYNLYAFINNGKNFKGKKFIYISKNEFNNKLQESYTNPAIKVYGNPYREKGE